MATALACLSLAQVGMFRSTGIPCAIGVLVGMFAALTLTPALIGLAGRRGMLEPRRSAIGHRWLARTCAGGQRRTDRHFDSAAHWHADWLERTCSDPGRH